MKLSNIQSYDLLPKFAQTTETRPVCAVFDDIVKHLDDRLRSVPTNVGDSLEYMRDDELAQLARDLGVLPYYPDLPRNVRINLIRNCADFSYKSISAEALEAVMNAYYSLDTANVDDDPETHDKYHYSVSIKGVSPAGKVEWARFTDFFAMLGRTSCTPDSVDVRADGEASIYLYGGQKNYTAATEAEMPAYSGMTVYVNTYQAGVTVDGNRRLWMYTDAECRNPYISPKSPMPVLLNVVDARGNVLGGLESHIIIRQGDRWLYTPTPAEKNHGVFSVYLGFTQYNGWNIILKEVGPGVLNTIKFVREYTGLSLRDSKILVDGVKATKIPAVLNTVENYNVDQKLQEARMLFYNSFEGASTGSVISTSKNYNIQ